MKQIHVTIDKGTAVVETEGFKGAACKDATAELEAAMGKKTHGENTPEFNLREERVVGQ